MTPGEGGDAGGGAADGTDKEEDAMEPWVAAAVEPVRQLIEGLPATHKRVLQHVVQFLREIDPVSTRMNPDNLAICFAPCFFRNADMMQVCTPSLCLRVCMPACLRVCVCLSLSLSLSLICSCSPSHCVHI